MNYKLPQNELIFDLIEEANPGFGETYQVGDLTFGTPANQSVPSGGIADTNVKVSPANDKMFGRQTVQYRRVDLEKLFKNVRIDLDFYTPGSITAEQVRQLINERFGLSISEEDITGTTNWASSTSQRFLTILSSSLCYKGRVYFYWQRGKQTLEQLLPQQEIAALQWPGGNDFSEGRKPTGDFMFYGLDCSEQSGELNVWGSPATNGTGTATFINWLNEKTGANLESAVNHNVEGSKGVLGLTRTRYSLPHASLPEANSTDYNRAMVFFAREDSWFTGKLIFHYNV